MAKKIRKPSGLKLDGSPTLPWKKFKQRLDEYNNTPIHEWQTENALGHILKRYMDYTGIEWALSYSGAPTKCKEIFCTNRMIAALGTQDFSVIKNYIDFVFDNYIIKNKMDITSLALFFTLSFISAFKAEVRKSKNITRSTELPESYQPVTKPLNIKTYGDLAFAKMAIESDPEDNLELVSLFNKLENIGFNKEVLEKISA